MYLFGDELGRKYLFGDELGRTELACHGVDVGQA